MSKPLRHPCERFMDEVIDLKYKLADAHERERALRKDQEELVDLVKYQSCELDRLRIAVTTQSHAIEQTLGRALGYPRFADDPANFPDVAADDPSVCVGEHVAETLATEAARKIADLTAALAVAGQPKIMLIEIAPTVFRVDCEVTETHSTTFYGPQAEAEARAFKAKTEAGEQ